MELRFEALQCLKLVNVTEQPVQLLNKLFAHTRDKLVSNCQLYYILSDYYFVIISYLLHQISILLLNKYFK